MVMNLNVDDCLPEDVDDAILLGRAWVPGHVSGPSPITIREGRIFDLSDEVTTVSELLNAENPTDLIKGNRGEDIGSLSEILGNTDYSQQKEELPYFLAPVDLQAIKACGVTFAQSMLERVIEERADGDPGAAERIREEIRNTIGLNLSDIIPGSAEAAQLKSVLVSKGMWSQYLEVGIGPDAEVFTKAQPMSAVGVGAEVGLLSKSEWNNPEPEITLIVNSDATIVGATLGNDVNLRDIEGRSALLLGKAKDNNASAAIGPFIRLFDKKFTLSDVRSAELSLTVTGLDQFTLRGRSSMSQISRDVEDLVSETIGQHHQYPDGLCLMTGTLFAPSEDRDKPGGGFTHKVGDVVRISTPKLGALVNRVNHSEKVEPWTFGVGALIQNLAARRLLKIG
ncbi:fumarylacetoacetate hydrolase family protein [Alphaproteobacteria bacterium]|nr:fumarylacetoacetate hydrolase family protein [Alphaproteobacteria bacterium]